MLSSSKWISSCEKILFHFDEFNLKGEKMISKELLSDVLKNDILDIEVEGSLIWYKTPTIINGNSTNKELSINIYELAHECKEWALSKGYYFDVLLRFDCEDYYCCIKVMHCVTTDINIDEDTEIEAIFKACEWILKETK